MNNNHVPKPLYLQQNELSKTWNCYQIDVKVADSVEANERLRDSIVFCEKVLLAIIRSRFDNSECSVWEE